MFKKRKCVAGFCTWDTFGTHLGRVRAAAGLRWNHGTSPDRSEFPRVHDARVEMHTSSC
jgi:hypothetical protein